MLTKSLHTVTAATNVAQLLLEKGLVWFPVGSPTAGDAVKLAKEALTVLNQYVGTDFSGQDPTVNRICDACSKLLHKRYVEMSRKAAA